MAAVPAMEATDIFLTALFILLHLSDNGKMFMPLTRSLSLGFRGKYEYIHFRKEDPIMKHILLLIFVTVVVTAQGQIRTRGVSIHNAFTENLPAPSQKNLNAFQTFFKGDPQRSFRMSIPLLTHKISPASRTSDAYWAGYMTTQSMRNGKFGTYYFWDIQGNLRESRFFVDINRNKYSFKIVVPRL